MGSDDGERKLLLAMLTDVIKILFGYPVVTAGVSRERLYDEAHAWLISNESHTPFTFVCVCAALRVDPHWLRGRLLKESTKRLIRAKRKRMYWASHDSEKRAVA